MLCCGNGALTKGKCVGGGVLSIAAGSFLSIKWQVNILTPPSPPPRKG